MSQQQEWDINFKVVPISEITVGRRARSGMRGIDRLAELIRDHGMFHWIGLSPDYELIFGQRRLEAVKKLGRKTIPALILDTDSPATLEAVENMGREEFSVSERVAVAEEIIRQMGERRGRPGRAGEIVANLPQLGRGQSGNDLPQLEGERTRDYAAKLAGFTSTGTFRNAQKVVEKGADDLVDMMDEGRVSVSAAADVADMPREWQGRFTALIESGAGTHDASQFIKDYRKQAGLDGGGEVEEEKKGPRGGPGRGSRGGGGKGSGGKNGKKADEGEEDEAESEGETEGEAGDEDSGQIAGTLAAGGSGGAPPDSSHNGDWRQKAAESLHSLVRWLSTGGLYEKHRDSLEAINADLQRRVVA